MTGPNPSRTLILSLYLFSVLRFHTYVESTRPVIDSFAQVGKVRQIDSTAPVEQVYAAVRSIFGNNPSSTAYVNAQLASTAATPIQHQTVAAGAGRPQLQQPQQQQSASTATKKPKVVFVLGGPGAGKGK